MQLFHAFTFKAASVGRSVAGGLLLVASSGSCLAADNSGILLQIVQQCIQTETPGYCDQCRAPQRKAICPGKTSCPATTELWAENADFVAIRDIKMCGCPFDFVHGLVLPKAVVTGVEDERRPDAIWQFAWNVGIERIPVNELALAVNAKSKRTQHQLHVHVVRLKSGPLPKLDASWVGLADQLDQVWQVASLAAQARQMNEYGVLVARAAQGGFRVAITAESPEGQFTQAVCSP